MSRLAILCLPNKALLDEAAERVAVGALAMGAQPDRPDTAEAFEPSVLAGYDAVAFGLGTDFDKEAFLSRFSLCICRPLFAIIICICSSALDTSIVRRCAPS